MPSSSTLRAPARRLRSRAPERAPNQAIVLGLILTCYLMIVLDASVVITALPRIQSSLRFSDADLSWVQNAYTLAFGGLLLLGARAGDVFGRRRVFLAGIALFTAASLAGGVAQTSTWLLAARAIQGVGAAIAAPATLTLLTTTFREGRERTRALTYYAAVAGGGGSVGLVIGGMLTQWASWRWGLFINVPIGAALILLTPLYLPEAPRQRGRFDLAGAISSTVGMTAVVYGFVRAGADGWGDGGTIAAFAVGVALLATFVLTELRAAAPITPLRLFASRERSGAYAARVLLIGGMFTMFFFLTQFLQGVRGFDPLQAGLGYLPMTVVMFSMVQVVPRLTAKVGGGRVLLLGVTLAFVGMAWLSRIGDGTAFFPGIALPEAIIGVGMGAALPSLTAAGVAGVDHRDAGAASGLVNVAHQLGGSLGIGVAVAIAASAARSAAHDLPASVSQQLLARHELASSIGAAITGAAVFVLAALAIVVVVMRRPAAEPVAATVAGPARQASR
jgi:EmrB/QacA subfamily drug resistance transporter